MSGAGAILVSPVPGFSRPRKAAFRKVVWNQNRAQRFTIAQSPLEVTIDTGDGSLFGVREPVTASPLVYKLDGKSVTVIDRGLGDLPGFARKIRTEGRESRITAGWKTI
jgi:hypothetical protein